ncbi:expressed unknown protein [Seminavis robusta]|uniref:Uncharacterized protein n=1 Tax=Seminavis robusta TaxID=568900 RepID=A0A9N8EDS1_9STRA|nr:expressed unknown protein [Seminavis robusta]|eukprot:Sro795_g203480.1 n/a (229) ;mRNA; f:16737-17423
MNNTPVLVHQAALLNREGIAALSCGNSAKAHACFKHVLEIMGYITQFPNLPQGHAATAWLQGVSPVSIPNFDNERFFIYNCALMFQPVASPNFTQLDITLYSAAAIFNMALAYHQRAVQTAGSSSASGMLRIAARMYDQCLQIVRSLPAGIESDASALVLIVLNNRSHIYFETQNYEKASAMLDHVQRLSRSMVRHNAVGGPVLQTESFEEIALNVLVTTRPSTAACA